MKTHTARIIEWDQKKGFGFTYQIMFWLVVAVYQLIALDSLLDWKLIRSVFGSW